MMTAEEDDIASKVDVDSEHPETKQPTVSNAKNHTRTKKPNKRAKVKPVREQVVCWGRLQNKKTPATKTTAIAVATTHTLTLQFDRQFVLNNDDQCTPLAAGWVHSLAVSDDGSCYGWGSNANHAIADSTDVKLYSQPTLIPFQLPLSCQPTLVRSVACGMFHSLAIDRSGKVWSWGSGAHGKLGHGHNFDHVTKPR